MRTLLVTAALSLIACGPADQTGARTPASATFDLRPLEASLKKNEADVLGALGRGDPRFALRVPKPDDADDEHEHSLHTASVRAQSIEEAQTLLGQWSGATALKTSTAKGASGLRLERELLERIVSAERFRVEEEKDLPRAGSEIVRGIIQVGADPAKSTWVARRLEEIRLMLRPEALTLLESAELDDSLDPLERAAAPAAQAAIANLRVALAEIHPAPPRAADPEHLSRALQAHLGVTGTLAVQHDALVRTEAMLREEVKAQKAHAQAIDATLAETHAEELLTGGATRCTDGHPGYRAALTFEGGSVLREAVAPPERWAACHAVRALATARPGTETLTALIAVHDGVTLALWALATCGEGMTPDRASNAWRLLADIPPEHQARVQRAAIAHPVAAIATGLAIQMVTRAGIARAPNVAAAWLRFGDAPFDIIEREGVLQ